MYTCFNCKKIIKSSETVYMFLDKSFCSNTCRRFYKKKSIINDNFIDSSITIEDTNDIEDTFVSKDNSETKEQEIDNDIKDILESVESDDINNHICIIQ